MSVSWFIQRIRIAMEAPTIFSVRMGNLRVSLDQSEVTNSDRYLWFRDSTWEIEAIVHDAIYARIVTDSLP